MSPPSREPYWTDGQVTLYLGDCRTVTEWLAADVLVTDPPYGRGYVPIPAHHGGKGPFISKGTTGIAGDEDTSVRDAVLSLWGKRPGIVFGDFMLAPAPGTRQVLAYQKPPNAGAFGAKGGWRRDIEAVYLIGPWSSALGGRSSVLATGARWLDATAKRYQHPHAKPVDVMETLIATCPPGVIADPFAGSGSTLVAARNLGKQAIGVEIDERYAEQAARRLAQGVLVAS